MVPMFSVATRFRHAHLGDAEAPALLSPVFAAPGP
jgi:hypothetical protein